MNGKQMLTAMSFVDEKYIDEADQPAARRGTPWRGLLAMAACFCLIVFAARAMLPAGTKESIATYDTDISTTGVVSYQAPAQGALEEAAAQRGMEDAAEITAESSTCSIEAPNAAVSGSALVPVKMTVRVDSSENGLLLCTITDPGSSAFAMDAQVKLTPPEIEEAAEEEIEEPADYEPNVTADAGDVLYEVTFLPAADGETILLLTMTPID